jgi:choline dehydrogenase
MASVVIKEMMLGANVTSDEDMAQYIMKSSYQDWHAFCTCRVGK